MNLEPGRDYIITEDKTLLPLLRESDHVAIGGFHTLCADVEIPRHPLSGYRAGDPLPSSLWNLAHRAKCGNNAGMVYDRKRDIWVDIYLYSDPASGIISKSLGDYEKIAIELGKRLPKHKEFSSLAKGSNEMTNIEGSKFYPLAGGHKDTQGRRMISNIGCEDCAGLVWQWLQTKDRDDETRRLIAGGPWANATSCGSRYRFAYSDRVHAYSYFSARFVSEPLYLKRPAQ